MYELSRRDFLRTAPAGITVANDIGAKLGAAAATGLGAILASFGNARGEQAAADSFAEALAYALKTSPEKVNLVSDGTYTVETPMKNGQKVKIEYHPEMSKNKKPFKVHVFRDGIQHPIIFESDDGWYVSRVIEYDKASKKVTRTLNETMNPLINASYGDIFIKAVEIAEKYLKMPVASKK